MFTIKIYKKVDADYPGPILKMLTVDNKEVYVVLFKVFLSAFAYINFESQYINIWQSELELQQDKVSYYKFIYLHIREEVNICDLIIEGD